MSHLVLHRIAATHPAIVQACLTSCTDNETADVLWEAPTENEWRRAALAIAKQVAFRVAGYRDEDEFARDGCQFAWDVFEAFQRTSCRGH